MRDVVPAPSQTESMIRTIPITTVLAKHDLTLTLETTIKTTVVTNNLPSPQRRLRASRDVLAGVHTQDKNVKALAGQQVIRYKMTASSISFQCDMRVPLMSQITCATL